MSVERWLPIPSAPGYEVSDLGRVRSLLRWRAEPGPRLLAIKKATGGREYRLVKLSISGKKVTSTIHSLVLEAFVGPRPAGMVTRHLNGNPADNRAGNLAWGTPTENNLDQVVHGTHPWACRDRCSQGHPYTPDNVRMNGRKRVCRPCQRLWYHQRKAARAATQVAA